MQLKYWHIGKTSQFCAIRNTIYCQAVVVRLLHFKFKTQRHPKQDVNHPEMYQCG